MNCCANRGQVTCGLGEVPTRACASWSELRLRSNFLSAFDFRLMWMQPTSCVLFVESSVPLGLQQIDVLYCVIQLMPRRIVLCGMMLL
jgi:hypothetical protein